MTREDVVYGLRFFEAIANMASFTTIDNTNKEIYRITIPDGRSLRLDYAIIGKRIGGTDGAAGDAGTFNGTFIASAESGALVLNRFQELIDADNFLASWKGTIGYSSSGNDLIINVNGQGNLTALWKARFKAFWIDQPLAITSASPLPAGVIGAAYTYSFTRVYGLPNVTWDMAGGALPLGLSMDNAGNITGTIDPSLTAATYSFNIRATDGEGNTDVKLFALSIS